MTATDPLSAIWVALEGAGCDPCGAPHDFYSRCPVHNGDSRSLHVSEGCDRRVLLNCFARQCSADAITKALGLPMAGLFPSGHHRGPRLQLVDAHRRDFTGNTRLLVNLLYASQELDGATDWRFEKWGCAYCGDPGAVLTFVSWRSRPVFRCPNDCSLDAHLQALAGCLHDHREAA